MSKRRRTRLLNILYFLYFQVCEDPSFSVNEWIEEHHYSLFTVLGDLFFDVSQDVIEDDGMNDTVYWTCTLRRAIEEILRTA